MMMHDGLIKWLQEKHLVVLSCGLSTIMEKYGEMVTSINREEM